MFSEKTNIEKLACEILTGILSIPRQSTYLTQCHKENSEYYNEFQKELTYEQIKDFDSLISIRNAVESTEFDYTLLYGIQIKSAIDEILENPLKILKLCDGNGIPAREIYKSIKQKRKDQ